MPPGITICRVASITRRAESAASVPGAASAAMVSPATATSQLTTPCGVTTSPPRMMRSNIVPPAGLGKALVDAVFVIVQAGNEAAGFHAVRQPRESLPRQIGRARPKLRIMVALQRAGQKLARDVRVVGRNRIGQFRPAVLGDPGERAADRAHHGVERRAVAADAL